jgi:hypothetical protein
MYRTEEWKKPKRLALGEVSDLRLCCWRPLGLLAFTSSLGGTSEGLLSLPSCMKTAFVRVQMRLHRSSPPPRLHPASLSRRIARKVPQVPPVFCSKIGQKLSSSSHLMTSSDSIPLGMSCQRVNGARDLSTCHVRVRPPEAAEAAVCSPEARQ